MTNPSERSLHKGNISGENILRKQNCSEANSGEAKTNGSSLGKTSEQNISGENSAREIDSNENIPTQSNLGLHSS